MKFFKKNFNGLLFCIGVFLCQWSQATIMVKITPSRPAAGEEFHVIFNYQGQAANMVPDLGPLAGDFTIMSTNKSSQVSMVNGEISASTRWVVGLLAKNPGRFQIPAINFGAERSQGFVIEVAKSHVKPSATANKDVFLDISVDKKSAYVQSQILYTVRLYFAKRLSGADFQAPFADDVVLMSLGKSRSFETTVNGRSYQVLEQKYALFPEKSGKVVIQPPIFKGIVERTDYRRIDQILMDVQRPITLAGQALTLDILPIPQTFKGNRWLPAKSLSLTEHWQGLMDGVRVGQPITRVITLQAKGVTASQLPNLTFASSDNVKVYPESPKAENTMSGGDVVGKKTVKVVYIPSQDGEFKVPELSLFWWDVTNNLQQQAHLNSRQFQIEGRLTSSKHNDSTSASSKAKVTVTPQQKIMQPPSTDAYLPWVLVCVLLLSWFIYLAAKFWRRGMNSAEPVDSSANEVSTSLSQLKKQLKQACVNNDAPLARTVLLMYAKKLGIGRANSLSSIANAYQSAKFTQAIEVLQAALYSTESKAWQGHALWVAFLSIEQLKTKPKKINRSPLPPLYP